jgi:dipeptidyl-peptidase 4
MSHVACMRTVRRATFSARFVMPICGLGVSVGIAATPKLTTDDYARAERFLVWNEERYILNGDIQHHWIGSEDRFWYLRTTADNGKEFVVVDAAAGSRTAAFDQSIIAAGLSRLTKTNVDAAALPFTVFRYTKDKRAIQFQVAANLLTCRLRSGACTSEPSSAGKPDEAVSPDGKWAAYLKDHNLWIRQTAGGSVFALTTDGIEHYDYASEPGSNRHVISDGRHRESTPPQVIWSPDSEHIVTYRLDERDVKDLFLIQSVPEDGSARPKLYTYRYPLPGDENVPRQEPVVFDVATRRQVKLDTRPIVVAFDPLISRHEMWWSADSAKIYYLNTDRFGQSISLNVADPTTGQVTELLSETTNTFVQPGDGRLRGGGQDYPTVSVLKNGDVIWYSERDGWGQLYYYYGSTGQLRNQITRGEWVVRDIVRIDEAAGKMFFTAGGREVARDPYERYLYSINLDGSGMTLLTPEDAEHQIYTPEKPRTNLASPTAPDSLSTAEEKSGFSSSGRYFVYSYSRPNMAPVLALRTADGRLVKQLEAADISLLTRGGYTPVEPFQVTAADGKTAIYGNIYRPSTLDPGKRYPVVDAIYPGPQMTRTAKDFASATFDALGASALAELGFIVITIDGRGTPHRSRAFLDNVYGQMGKAGNLDDHIAGIRQLAQRYPYMDLDRVGIFGVSGGGYASTHAILTHPDFYKVAVSAEGNHDQLGYLAAWAETYNGAVGEGDYKDSANEALAGNLTGKLLLMHGDMDDNVSPSLTLKMVDGLVKANKDFDLLIIPNGNHHIFLSPYFIRRQWDYFVRNLMGAEPPSTYEIRQPQWFSALSN